MKKLLMVFAGAVSAMVASAETINVTAANFESHRTTGNAFYSVCVALWTGTAAAKETSNVNPPNRALVIPVPANAEKGFMVLESRDATK